MDQRSQGVSGGGGKDDLPQLGSLDLQFAAKEACRWMS